ncbi:MAG: YhfC family intramembrane metalloprotease [Clostridiales bacterium]|jgi:uncharacterized membrane protein YhfC|nr:YhfC family intramembrane metalloprotease [Clostridiales bacterium]
MPVSNATVVCVCISLFISVSVPVILFFVLRKSFNLKVVPVIVGAVVFIIFALLLEQLLHSIVLQPQSDGTIALMSKYPVLFVLYCIFAAGIFEETARFLSFNLMKKSYDGFGTALSYGIGHGGIESILLVGTAMFSNLAIIAAINSGVTEIVSSLPLETVIALKSTPPTLFLVAGVERIMAIILQISLSVLVWKSVSEKKILFYPLAIVIHAVADLPAILAQMGIISNIWIVEAIVFVIVALTVFGEYKLFKKAV